MLGQRSGIQKPGCWGGIFDAGNYAVMMGGTFDAGSDAITLEVLLCWAAV